MRSIAKNHEMEYSLNGHHIDWLKQLATGDNLIIRASEIRRERTGIHAKISIYLNETLEAWSNFNVERDEERVRLSNKAHKLFGEVVGTIFPKEYMTHELDIFCEGLWEAALGRLKAEEVAGDPTLPLEYIAHPHMITGGGTIMFAPPGRGKSYTALLLAISIDEGVNTFWQVKQQKALFVNLERDRSGIQRRVGCINTVLGCDPHRPLLCFNARGKSLGDLKDAIAREIERHKAEVMFLDSISRTGQGSLTEDAPVNRIADTLNELCPSWFATGHTARADESHVFGSQMFDAVADIMLRVHSQEKPDTGSGPVLGIGIEVTKANEGAKPKMMMLGYKFDQFGLSEVWKASARDFPELIASQKISTEEKIALFFRTVKNEGSADDLAEYTGRARNTISSILANDRRFVMVSGTGGRGKGAKLFALRSIRDDDERL